MITQNVRIGVRFGIALFFLWAAFAKVLSPVTGPTMYKQWLSVLPLMRYFLPVLEASLGIWLVVDLWPRATAIVTVGLLSAFTGLITAQLFGAHRLPCGCMGEFSVEINPHAIWRELLFDLGRNALLIGGAWYLYLSASKRARAVKAASV